MPIFRVHHREKKQFQDQEAETAQEACDMCYWSREDCDVKVKTPKGGWAKVDTGEIVETPMFENVQQFMDKCQSEYGLDEEATLKLLKVRSVSRLEYRDLVADWKTIEEKAPALLEQAASEAISRTPAPEQAQEPEQLTEGELSEEEKAKLEEVKDKVDKVADREVKIGKVLQEPTKAEKGAWENRVHIMQLAQSAQSTFLKMGSLMYKAREDADWTILSYESFKEYIEDLGLPMQNSYSWATRLIGIYEYLAVKMNIPEKILIEIGVAKLTRLLPLARDGALTMDMLEQAKILSDLDLRAMLGHDVEGGGEAKPDYVVCPRCGNSFDQKKAQRSK